MIAFRAGWRVVRSLWPWHLSVSEKVRPKLTILRAPNSWSIPPRVGRCQMESPWDQHKYVSQGPGVPCDCTAVHVVEWRHTHCERNAARMSCGSRDRVLPLRAFPHGSHWTNFTCLCAFSFLKIPPWLLKHKQLFSPPRPSHHLITTSSSPLLLSLSFPSLDEAFAIPPLYTHALTLQSPPCVAPSAFGLPSVSWSQTCDSSHLSWPSRLPNDGGAVFRTTSGKSRYHHKKRVIELGGGSSRKSGDRGAVPFPREGK